MQKRPCLAMLSVLRVCFLFSSRAHMHVAVCECVAGCCRVCVCDSDAAAWSCGRQPDAHKLICTHDELRWEDDKRVRATGTCLHGNRRQDDEHLLFLPTTCQIRLTLCPSSLTSEISLSLSVSLSLSQHNHPILPHL